MKIMPSILGANSLELAKEVTRAKEAGISGLHIDVMDGHFVPNLGFTAQNVKDIKQNFPEMEAEVHLMVANPEQMIGDFIDAGADTIEFHIESTTNAYHLIQQIKKSSVKAGIVISPSTPVSVIMPLLELVDQVLVMTVNPGFGGQSFIKEMIPKVAELAGIKNSQNASFEIEVDGGINDNTFTFAKEAGATVAVAGSYLFNGNNFHERLSRLI
ncbi:ribulose-phosphate 3-epimerase [Holzapfeliella sp. He02]|uniref:Ribulose-phosphate 3-epimerase n=1 Tax=Holzapfeliella saturejae TaxID=3082953 RepID=A0ABU8SIP3_9LACO